MICAVKNGKCLFNYKQKADILMLLASKDGLGYEELGYRLKKSYRTMERARQLLNACDSLAEIKIYYRVGVGYV